MTGIVFVLSVLGVLVAVAVVGFFTLDVGTHPGDEVLATVADDPDLPRVEVNGYTFHAETHSDATHPVIIVLRGGPGGDYRSLLALTDLADRYRVVFFDQRSAGLSTRVPAEELTAQTALAEPGYLDWSED